LLPGNRPSLFRQNITSFKKKKSYRAGLDLQHLRVNSKTLLCANHRYSLLRRHPLFGHYHEIKDWDKKCRDRERISHLTVARFFYDSILRRLRRCWPEPASSSVTKPCPHLPSRAFAKQIALRYFTFHSASISQVRSLIQLPDTHALSEIERIHTP
jgi:hypothetical protein